uniref:STAS domain-containing protein n=1 Tax=Electrophorus electricus TaxID=8005 RepID=A0A4W4DS94_ELEEL
MFRLSSMMDVQNQYCVSRPIYSIRAFEHVHERQIRETKSLKERFSGSCRCSTKRVWNIVKMYFPVLGWLPIYQIKQWLPGDIVAGITTGMVCALQGLAYSLLVNVAPVYGLYAAFFPILTYFILGTSRHLSVGPFPVTCLMVGAVVLTLAPDSNFILAIAMSMTVLIGVFQVAMGVVQLGFLVRYLSDPLVGGFTTAAALQVVVSQLKIIFNVPVGNYNGILSLFYTIGDVFKNIKQTNLVDLVAAVLTIIVVMVVKEINAKFQKTLPVPIPIEVFVTIIDAGVSYALNLSGHYGAGVVNTIPRGFIPPQPPDVSLFSSIAGSSFSTGVVSYAIAISVAKVYAAKHELTVDGNQELLAFGISNIFCGAFSGFVATTALSRTAIQEIIYVMSADVLIFPQFIWVFTCISCIVLGLDIGLLTGLVFELATVVIRTQFPSCASLGNAPSTDIYKNMKDYKAITEIPGIKVFKCTAPIYFANIEYLKDQIKHKVGFDAVRVFKKRNKALKKIHRLIKKGKLKFTEVHNHTAHWISHLYIYKYLLSIQICQTQLFDFLIKLVKLDWTSVLPVNVNVPKVNIHSLVMDFSAVSFLDVMAAKSLKLILKEFLRIGVSVYIAGCDGMACLIAHVVTICVEWQTSFLFFLFPLSSFESHVLLYCKSSSLT